MFDDDCTIYYKTNNMPGHFRDFDELPLLKATATTATRTDIYTTVTHTDITGDFLCPTLLARLRIILGRPTGPIFNTDVAGITELNFFWRNITSLEGIRHFSALTVLNVSVNHLTRLDVSNNMALKVLLADSNKLTRLDVSNNTALEVLSVDRNQLTRLDVSNNTALEVLRVNGNCTLRAGQSPAKKFLLTRTVL